jgi:hypothetical protein
LGVNLSKLKKNKPGDEAEIADNDYSEGKKPDIPPVLHLLEIAVRLLVHDVTPVDCATASMVALRSSIKDYRVIFRIPKMLEMSRWDQGDPRKMKSWVPSPCGFPMTCFDVSTIMLRL